MIGTMLPGILTMLVSVVVDCSSPVELDISVDEQNIIGWQAAADGLKLLSDGDVNSALTCLRKAQEIFSNSEIIARDLGLALLQAEKYTDALKMLRHARTLGDPGRQQRVAESIAIARIQMLDDTSEDHVDLVVKLLNNADDIESQLILSLLHPGHPTKKLSLRLEDETREGFWANLVLAYENLRRGRYQSHSILFARAKAIAEKLDDPLFLSAIKKLKTTSVDVLNQTYTSSSGMQIDDVSNNHWLSFFDFFRRISIDTKFFAGAEHVSNVRWRPVGMPKKTLVKGVLAAAVSSEIPLYGAVLWSSLQAEMSSRFGWDMELLLGVPTDQTPMAPLVGFRARLTELYHEGLSDFLGRSVEIGPILRLSLGAAWYGELSLYGTWLNSDEIQSFVTHREITGQRLSARFGYQYKKNKYQFGIMALHNEARGQTFDMLGGNIDLSASWSIFNRLSVGTNLSFGLGQIGPFGDQSVIGDAQLRFEGRFLGQVRLMWHFSSHWSVTVENTYLTTFSRESDRYWNNFVRSGIIYKF